VKRVGFKAGVKQRRICGSYFRW